MGLFTDGFKLLKKASEPLYKTPKSIQETIEIMAVAENGIFEVSKNKYSKDEASGRATKMKRWQSIDMSPKELLMHTTGRLLKISSDSSVRS